MRILCIMLLICIGGFSYKHFNVPQRVSNVVAAYTNGTSLQQAAFAPGASPTLLQADAMNRTYRAGEGPAPDYVMQGGSEDATYYYLTMAEFQSVQAAVQQALITRNLVNPKLSNGTIIQFSFREWGNMCLRTGHPEQISVALVKKIRLISPDRKFVTDVIPWL